MTPASSGKAPPGGVLCAVRVPWCWTAPSPDGAGSQAVASVTCTPCSRCGPIPVPSGSRTWRRKLVRTGTPVSPGQMRVSPYGYPLTPPIDVELPPVTGIPRPWPHAVSRPPSENFSRRDTPIEPAFETRARQGRSHQGMPPRSPEQSSPPPARVFARPYPRRGGASRWTSTVPCMEARGGMRRGGGELIWRSRKVRGRGGADSLPSRAICWRHLDGRSRDPGQCYPKHHHPRAFVSRPMCVRTRSVQARCFGPCPTKRGRALCRSPSPTPASATAASPTPAGA